MVERDEPRPARPEELAALARVFGAAFAADPMIRWPMPDGTAADDVALFTAILTPYVAADALWTVADHAVAASPADLAGAAWLPPAVTARLAEMERVTRAQIYPLTPDGGARYDALWDWLGEHAPRQPHWFLDAIAVAPAAQGRGLGRTLVRHGLALARADGLPAYLETGRQANVAYYAALGFSLYDARPAPGGGPMVWFMTAS